MRRICYTLIFLLTVSSFQMIPTVTTVANASANEFATSSDGTTASACDQVVGTPNNVTVVRQGNYCTLTFIGNSTWNIPNGVANVEAVVVGGGGGGGFGNLGGGGGAGEVLVSGNTTLASGEVTGASAIAVSPGSITIVIGSGGTSGAPTGATNLTANWAAQSGTATKGGNGGSSLFGSVTADGGGGGGGGSSPNFQGQTGGSGGGSAIGGKGGLTDSTNVAGWTAYKNSGETGTAGSAPNFGGLGGGGGAGSAGGVSATGNGGSGILIWGVRLAGGGGGWTKLGAQGNLNDVILGGNGRLDSGNWPYAGTSNNSSPGAANTGTGGGAGAPGGSGIVIVRYPIVCELNAANTTSVNGGHTIVQIKNTDTCLWRVPASVTSARILVIGGGGAGGGGIGGGGGAGEFVETTTALTPSTDISIVVGRGGTPREWIGGNAGQNSSFSSIIAHGGGGGGTNEANGPTASQGPNLGSQGGGGYPNISTSGSNPAPIFAIASASDSIRFRNNGGVGSNGTGSAATGGGGGGASGVGAPGTTNNAGNGGAGKSSAITGSTVFYAAGGGGGVNGASSPGFTASIANGDPGVGGSGIGGNGGQESTSNPGNQFGNRGDGTNGTVDSRGTAGNTNTGSGGGGASNWSYGGAGGSGVVVIRYITNLPTILTQPLSDTTTAGIVETFTLTTNAAPAPLSKSVQWQFTTDTATGVSGWTNVSSGTGGTTDTFTTVALTTSMNRYWFRAIITFSDTSTLSVTETTTAVILTINPAITITSDTSTITRKYGDTQTVRTLVYSGGTTNTGAVGTSTSHTVRGSFGTLASGRITLDTATTTSVFRVDTGTVVGSYVETITVTDAKGATATYAQRVVVNQADTLTISSETPTATTYTGLPAIFNETFTVTGLVAGDAVSGVTYNYSASSATCANGGLCNVGDVGPSGGNVFYVSPTIINIAAGISSGGIYLEAAPVAAQGNAQFGCTGTQTPGTSYAVGSGAANTLAIINNCATAGIAARVTSNLTYAGFSDWFMPSLDEMTAIYNNLYNRTPSLGGFTGIDYGSSSQGTSGDGYQAYWWFGAGAVSGQTNKNYVAAYRPVRSFNPIFTSAVNYGPTTTKPTNAGTYTITPSAVLANNVDTSNYFPVFYRTSTFTINKARQDTLTVGSVLGVYETGTATMQLTTLGGSDTGTVTYTIASGGTATGCSLSSNVLTVTSAGTCRLAATKAATLNYLITYSDTATITFTRFVERVLQVQLFPSMIPLNQGNALEKTEVVVPNISSWAPTPGVAGYTFTGTGFTNVITVSISGTSVPFTNPSATTIQITGAAGLSGPIMIETSDGRFGPVPFYLFFP